MTTMESNSSKREADINVVESKERIRKYLVLLQDSLAIKFVPLTQRQRDGTNDFGDEQFSQPIKEIKGNCGIEKNVQSTTMDGSIGIHLFEEFRNINLLCCWNIELHEAILHLEYKGTLLPSTILVGSSAYKYIESVKNAWTRKILKPPRTFRIEFIGEIEDMLADPIETSNFIPLSDSICWAIYQLTSKGEEAFVDGISSELVTLFPDTVLPVKELLFQVLERLTKAKKVYQTSQGYFVVTPENSNQYQLPSVSTANSPSDSVGREKDDDDCDSDIYHKADEAGQRQSAIISKSSLARCNSLFRSKKTNERVAGCLPRKTFSLRATKYLKNKSSSTPAKKVSVITTASGCNSESNLSSSKESLFLDRRRKHKSFLKNFLTFRRSSQSAKTKSKNSLEQELFLQNLQKEISTQTSSSLENILTASNGFLSVSTPTPSQSSPLLSSPSASPTSSGSNPDKHYRGHDSDSGRYTESSELEQALSHSQSQNEASASQEKNDIDNQGQGSSSTSNYDNMTGNLLNLNLTPVPSSRPPSSISSSTAYLSNLPYHRRYINYHYPNSASSKRPFTFNKFPSTSSELHLNKSPSPSPSNSASVSVSQLLPKYPPRPFEKKQIYERLAKPVEKEKRLLFPTLINKSKTASPTTTYTTFKSTLKQHKNSNIFNNTSTTTTTTDSVSEVQVEMLLPMGKLIQKVLTDFDSEENKLPMKPSEEEKELTGKITTDDSINNNNNATPSVLTMSKPKSGNNAFTFNTMIEAISDSPFLSSKLELTTHFSGSKGKNGKMNKNGSGIKTGIETVSFKPNIINVIAGTGDDCRESDIL